MSENEWTQEPITIAEHSYFWLGVERMTTPEGTTVTAGEQMYVEYLVPADIRRTYPVVLVHGGGGQGIAYLGPGNGRPGWAHYLLQEGYAVYIVDRPGHGRAAYDPERLGPALGPIPYEFVVQMFKVGAASGRWPGTGEIGDPAVDQFMAQQGPIIADTARAHLLWQRRGAELLDRIGPAILLTHSAGGPFGWVVGDARPELVKAIVCVEGLGPTVTGIPLTYDPPISSLSELSLEELPDAARLSWGGPLPPPPLVVQKEPARQLVNLKRVPIAFLTSEDPRFGILNSASIAYLRQAGCTVDDLRLTDLGIRGNGHFMPLEINNREVLQVILDWIETSVPAATTTVGASHAE